MPGPLAVPALLLLAALLHAAPAGAQAVEAVEAVEAAAPEARLHRSAHR